MIKEYLKLIPNIFKDFKNIVKGWFNNYNFNKLTKEQQEEVLKRRSICKECPFNSKNAKTSDEYKAIFGTNYSTKRMELHCSLCSCPIKQLTISLESECGLSKNKKTKFLKLKWNKINE